MKILIGSPVRQDEKIFLEYLKGIDNMLVPKEYQVDRFFILNDCPELEKHLKPEEYDVMNTGDTYVTNEQTHIWSPANLSKMSILRNRLIQKVLDEGYDYFFMVDSDIILHPLTLLQLLSDKKDLVANIFWTEGEPGKNAYWPNCWDYDQCAVDNMGNWIKQGIYEVGGTGACFLIKRNVLEAGVNYTPIPNIKCLVGEDRYFCIRAQVHGFKLFIDTHTPVIHLYRQSIYEEYIRLRDGGEAVGDIGRSEE